MPSKLGFHFTTGHFPDDVMRRMFEANCQVAMFLDDVDGMMMALEAGVPTVIFRTLQMEPETDDFTRWGGPVAPHNAGTAWWNRFQQWWGARHAWRYGPSPPTGAYYLAWNEPSGYEWMSQLATAEIARMEAMAQTGHKAGLFGFAAGCPPLPDHNPVDDPTGDKRLCWERLKPACEAALQYGAIVCLHEYWSPDPETWEDPSDLWNGIATGWLFKRWLKVRKVLGMDTLPIALTELGWDMVGSSWAILGYATPGWRTLCDWWAQHGEANCIQAAMTRLARADEAMREDPYCLGGTFFKTGGAGHGTYEAGDELRDEILARAERLRDQPDPIPEPPEPEPEEPEPEEPPEEPEPEEPQGDDEVDKHYLLELIRVLQDYIEDLMGATSDLNVSLARLWLLIQEEPAPEPEPEPEEPEPEPEEPTGVGVLTNGNLAGGDYQPYQWSEVRCGKGWKVAWLKGENWADPLDEGGHRMWGRPEIAIIPKAEPYLDPPRIPEGMTNAVKCFSMGRPMRVAFYQHVKVKPGQAYRFSVKALTWSCQPEKWEADDCDPHVSSPDENMLVRVGIAPKSTGDAPHDGQGECDQKQYILEPPAWLTDVSWCKAGDGQTDGWNEVKDTFIDLKVKKIAEAEEITAEEGTITVVVECLAQWAFKHCDFYWGAAELEEAGG